MYDLKTCSRDFAYPYPPKPPDLEDAACGLRVTASLADLLIESYFRDASTDGVCNTETLSLLSADDYHGGVAWQAYNVIRNYGVMTDIIQAIKERTVETAALLDAIERDRVSYRNISASYTKDPDEIRHLLYATKEVLLPESIEHIAIDVIESLKSSTPEQDVTIVTAMHLMKIAYLLYKEGSYERRPGESEYACAAGEESEQKS